MKDRGPNNPDFRPSTAPVSARGSAPASARGASRQSNQTAAAAKVLDKIGENEEWERPTSEGRLQLNLEKLPPMGTVTTCECMETDCRCKRDDDDNDDDDDDDGDDTTSLTYSLLLYRCELPPSQPPSSRPVRDPLLAARRSRRA